VANSVAGVDHSAATDPPLGQCPTWCDKPADHGWEDEWTDGPVRHHVRTIDQIDRFNAVRISEYEVFTSTGRTRQREINLDLDQPQGLDATGAPRLIAALTAAIVDFGEPI
jgi:hypothetical protein